MIDGTVVIIEIQMPYNPENIDEGVFNEETEIKVSFGNYQSDTIVQTTLPYSIAKDLKIGEKYTLNIDKA